MADGVYPAPAEAPLTVETARLFLVDTLDAPDALLKVLSVFAVQQVALATVDFAAAADGGQVRIEARRLSAERAQHLSERLRSVPVVRGVSVGWRMRTAS
ncbi:MAG: hypothetical protein P4L73_03055 [Caulobacteraceae bacterium]|nr:hypothetical protein [Caulobacteraceae bacterium]